MEATKENVKIGMWAYHCCHLDLRQIDEALLNDILDDIEYECLFYKVFNRKVDALNEILSMWIRSHNPPNCDCAEEIKKVFQMICEELKIWVL